MKKLQKVLSAIMVVFFATSFSLAQAIEVTVDQGLAPAIDYANQGNADVIILADDGGVYGIPSVEINVPLTIKAKDDLAVMPSIQPETVLETNDFIKINNDLTLDGVQVSGMIAGTSDYAKIKYMLKVPNTWDEGSVNNTPNLTVKNCVLGDIYKTGDKATAVDGSVWDVSKGGFCDQVVFENCVIQNTGDEALRAINGHKSDHIVNGIEGGGHFNSLTVKNCTFSGVNGSSVKLQGDADSSAINADVMIENCTFYNCGGQVIWSRAIDGVQVKNLIISDAMVNGTEDSYRAGRITYVEGLGSYVSHVDTFNMARIVGPDTVEIAGNPFVAGGGTNVAGTKYGTVSHGTIYGYDPQFADAAAGDFTLAANSSVMTLADNGGPLGDLNWATGDNSARIIQVTVAQGLETAIDYANAGNADVIELVDAGGVYGIPAVEINVPLTIRVGTAVAKAGYLDNNMPVIAPNDVLDTNDFIKINNDLTLDGVRVSGMIAGTSDYAKIKYMLKVPNTWDEGSVNNTPNLTVKNSVLGDIYKTGDPATAKDGTVWDVSKGGFCNVVSFENCIVQNTGDEALRAINGHKSDHVVNGIEGGGHFNALTIRNCSFQGVNGSSVKLQGDADSSAVNSNVLIENCTFFNCGGQVVWTRAIDGVICRNHIITDAMINGTEDGYRAGRIMYVEGLGSTISHVDTFNMARIVGPDTVEISDEPFAVGGGTNVAGTKDGTLIASTIYGVDPMFADAANSDFTLDEASPVLTLGNDGGPLGDLNWAPQDNTPVEEVKSMVAKEFTVSQNYPNPFNPTTSIKFNLAQSEVVNVTIYNVLGAVVETLVNEKMNAGSYTLTWDASHVATGIYFYRVQAGEMAVTKKMLLVK